MTLKVKNKRIRIPLPEKAEQLIVRKKEIYSRKMKYKKDWRDFGDEEIEYEKTNAK